MDHTFNLRSPSLANSTLTGWVLIFCGLLFFSVLAVLLLGLPDELGINIPSLDVESDYIWASTFSIAVLVGLFWLPLLSEERLALMIGWLAKSFVSLVAMLWYESYYYFLDAYSYFYNAQDYPFSQDTVVFGDGTELVTMICAVLLKVLPGGYHVVKEVFSLIGLAGIYCFYRSLVAITGKQKISWLIGLCLFPSICFWSSVIGKEPLALLGIGIFFLGGAKFYKRPEIGALLLVLIGIFITGGIRLWLVMIMLPCVLVLLFASNIATLWRAWAFILALLLGAVSVNMVTDRFEFASRQEAFERLDQSASGWAGDGGSG
ncbi:MAG: hypothetical protein LH481_15505, partial [Burkholderiales bacterium]|nr:hypothetical protein [Burkholderiales bacterium]